MKKPTRELVLLAIAIALSVALLPALTATSDPRGAPPPEGAVPVHVINEAGELVGPVAVPPVRMSEAAWRETLTPRQYRILRGAGTERPGSGALLENTGKGMYACAGCGLPLFTSGAKYKSGTGWPSFFEPVAPENVAGRADRSLGMVRTEINCARCDGHLGHVFNDGPQPTGLRYCVNSAALAFTPAAEIRTLAWQPPPDGAPASRQETAVLAGGCFWCVEAVFEQLEGVLSVRSGYAGGSPETARYDKVAAGRTKHAEAVQIIYDPSKIGYKDLLRVHFATHDPTQLDRQGNDVGRQYRSAVFYADARQRAAAQAVIDELKAEEAFSDPIVTTLEPLQQFHPAAAYHQDYVRRNPSNPYVRAVALPKVAKVRKLFADRLKPEPSEPPAEGG